MERSHSARVGRRLSPGFPLPVLSGMALLTAVLVPGRAFAADGIDGGDTAWILTSTALVLFMTIPGLSLFYGGLVNTKNVLSLLMQCLVLTASVTIVT